MHNLRHNFFWNENDKGVSFIFSLEWDTTVAQILVQSFIIKGFLLFKIWKTRKKKFAFSQALNISFSELSQVQFQLVNPKHLDNLML